MARVQAHSVAPSSLNRLLRWLASPRRQRLRFGIVVSLAVHAGVLSLGAALPDPARPPARGLEVVLVNRESAEAPAQARLLAQMQLDGGGADAEGHAQSPLPYTGEAAQAVVLEALRQRQRELEDEQRRLLTQLESRQAAPADKPRASAWEATREAGADNEDQPAVLQNAQAAALSEQVKQYNARPRKHFFAPSTSASPYAQYVDGWRARIEQTGTRHYPAEARGRLYGSLRMTVTLRADGSVAQIDIDRPAPHAILNQAARRIVQLAAPFPPFPPGIARETDLLSITRTWHFTHDRLEAGAP
ncbi:TonB protein [plant metagenome]|uniref:TonB protein n=1 Tax=plant metagenome TaxID=1297885 RepID=A0A484NTP5_9ZZZZ